MHFPAQSIASAAQAAGAVAAYDTDGDGQADFFTFANPAGRITRLGYGATPAGEAKQILHLDDPTSVARRHLVIILDGFGYDVVKGYYDSGGLRLFHPPSRVIAPYPTLTDLALEDALGYVTCEAFEAKYYDRTRERIVGGSWAYLAGANQPYNRLLDYRAKLIWDALGYVAPRDVFGKEVNDLARLLARSHQQEILGYLVSSAGISTADGAEGQRRALALVDRLVHQAVWSSRGRVQVTLLADHGHSYTPGKQLRLEEYLKSKGWRVTDSLRRDRDVASVRFGLETYASFGCRRPAELAADLAECPGITVASYVEGDSVVVRSAGGARAVIRKKGDRYGYEVQTRDPLALQGILASLQADAGGFYDDRGVFAATADHEFPDPLQRLWRAHFSVAKHTPDVIVSLANEYISGAASFGGAVKVASTHGGLNRANSTTFIMSTIGPLPALMRSADIPAAMSTLLGRPWPAKKPAP
ncbi:MAG: hypothetical protein MUP47_10260 [Phycisphaerae bacterium]|nr:hypothetical protein [Phycisphaerae bacterium]